MDAVVLYWTKESFKLLASSLFYAVASVLAKVYVRNVDPISMVGGRSVFTLLCLFSYSMLSGRLQTKISTNVFLYTFLGAFFASFLAIILFYKALSLLEISKATVIRSVGPFMTAIYSFVMLSLIPTLTPLISGTIIVIGVIILSLSKELSKQKVNTKDPSST